MSEAAKRPALAHIRREIHPKRANKKKIMGR